MTVTKREEKKQATRQKLLDKAQELLLEKGYTGLSVEDITRESGIAKGTFYNYFARKEDLLAELIRIQFRPLNDQIVEISEQEDVQSALAPYLLHYASIVEQMGREQWQSWIQFQLAKSGGESKWQLDVAVLADALDQSRFQHPLWSNLLLSEQIMTSIYGYLLLWAMGEIPSLHQSVKDYTKTQLPLLLGT